MFKRLIRDNRFINPVVSHTLRFLLNYSKAFLKLTHLYRVYGVVKLNIQNVDFKIYTLADDNIANEIFYSHGYEAEEFKLVSEIIRSSKSFIDIGANTGIFSIFAAKANPALKVLSFEPHPSNYARLTKNIEINQLTNIKTFPFALGQDERTIQFTIPADNSLSTTASVNEAFATHFHGVPQKSVEISQVKLDLALIQHGITSVDLIKIDVEYYELEVLKGSVRILTEIRPLLLVEILDYQGLLEVAPKMRGRINANHAAEIESLLLGMNYYPYGLSKDGIYSTESVLSGHDHRNFLFVPKLLPNKNYRFDELGSLFKGLTLNSNG